MQMSREGLEHLMDWEGVRLEPYEDVGGYLTIGVGHLLTDEELSSGMMTIKGDRIFWSHGLTREQALDLLAQDVEKFEIAVNDNVMVPLNQGQFDALVSFSFNVGPGAFANSTLLRVLNQGNYTAVPAQLLRWVKVQGRRVQGLVNRRSAEIDLWNS